MDKLRELKLEDEGAFRAWLAAWQDEPVQVSVTQPIQTSFPEFLQQLHQNSVDPKPPRVPATKYFYIDEGIIKGGISCRWALNAYLRNFGGHIGYGIVPAYRKRGIASEMLREALEKFHQRHIKRVLITAEVKNVASQKTICRAGGVYENTVTDPETGEALRRYWITLEKNSQCE
ncbi:GNAT family N-acetyltransferase [Pediococcus siamensis]|uniref:GNAT family N-acetyltransferase n=1 Tax=Pediococcus siamensis TaxID=381829 RepID=UPI0039A179BF